MAVTVNNFSLSFLTFTIHSTNTGMDWLCPAYNEVLARQLTAYHGNITAENTIHNIVSIVQTGDLHVAVYDLPNSESFRYSQ